jgi:aspartate 1-decarboxylase
VQVGDLVIVISYAQMEFEAAKQFQPSIVFVDENNRITQPI